MKLNVISYMLYSTLKIKKNSESRLLNDCIKINYAYYINFQVIELLFM